MQTTEDILAENSEDFTVSISSPIGGGGPTSSLGTPSSVTTTIRDNDALLLSPTNPSDVDIQLTVDPDSVNEGDGETTFTVTATLDSGSTRNEDTEITLILDGTADSSDYTGPTEASVTIPGGQNSGSGTLTLTLIDDELSEGDETIIVGGTSGDLAIDSALITVHDDDSAYLSIAGPTAEVTEGSNASFTVTLSKAVATDVTVAWSADTDTAVAADLSATSGSMTIPANSTTQTITVAVTDDALSEGSETFGVVLGADTGDQADTVWVKTTAASATATIAESDPITVAISGPASVDEGDVATFTVSLSPSGVTPTEDLTVSYTTSNGTATAGTDYTAKSGTLTFTATDAGDETFTVQTTEDILSETSETFTVTISSSTGGGGPTPSLDTSSLTTTISASDPITVSISGPASVGEGEVATYTVSISGGTPTADLTVDYATADGPGEFGATAGEDYTATSDTLIFSSGGTGEQTVLVQTTQELLIEPDETFTVTISSPSGGGGPAPSSRRRSR